MGFSEIPMGLAGAPARFRDFAKGLIRYNKSLMGFNAGLMRFNAARLGSRESRRGFVKVC